MQVSRLSGLGCQEVSALPSVMSSKPSVVCGIHSYMDILQCRAGSTRVLHHSTVPFQISCSLCPPALYQENNTQHFPVHRLILCCLQVSFCCCSCKKHEAVALPSIATGPTNNLGHWDATSYNFDVC